MGYYRKTVGISSLPHVGVILFDESYCFAADIYTVLLLIFAVGLIVFFFFNFKESFIYCWLCWIFVVSRGISLAAVQGIVIVVASLVSEFPVFSKCHTPLEQHFFSSPAHWGSCESAVSDSAGPVWTKRLHFRQDPRWCR